ncbi:MAG: peptidase M28 [Blastocatellia bacterium]|nr:MAG: peptidase M28 [Blastocatellia bacterium]
MRRFLAVGAGLGIAATFAASGIVSANGTRWWQHVQALANDSMAGRNTGTAEYQRAADYVAEQFQKAGLEPVGVNGYFQPVRFKTRTIVEAQSSLTLVRDGHVDPLALGEDANFSMRIDPAPSLEARLVFAGYGLHIPELGVNDLAGLRLDGAVVVYLAAAPPSISAPLQAHFGSASERWKMYKAAGAVGTISIANPGTVEIPWVRSTLARLLPQMSLADSALDDATGQQFAATMNPAHADKLFAGSGHTLQEVLALADAGNALPRFELPTRVKATVKVERSELDSPNVAGVLRGHDPARRGEYVVVSAHLDHVGVGEPVNGDRIYNGAMDNASGVAAILEIATQLQGAAARPARSILFVAVTGEEKGELGSKYFVAHPPVPGPAIVADVNIDMFLPLFPLKTLMVLGVDESDLGQDIRAVAADRGIGVQSDPEPERNRFVRSDQYSFIKSGIPALAMKVGYQSNTTEAATAARWTKERYHAPSDDLDQPIDLTAAEGYVEVVRSLVLRIANRPSRPTWNQSSFFKRFATSNVDPVPR